MALWFCASSRIKSMVAMVYQIYARGYLFVPARPCSTTRTRVIMGSMYISPLLVLAVSVPLSMRTGGGFTQLPLATSNANSLPLCQGKSHFAPSRAKNAA